MKRIASFLLLLTVLVAAGSAHAQTTCVGTAAAGPVTQCNTGQSYGCTATGTSTALMAADGSRTSIWFQNNGTANISVNFGDTAATATNGLIVTPGNALIWSNMPQGNTPGRVVTNNINIISVGVNSACVFLYTR